MKEIEETSINGNIPMFASWKTWLLLRYSHPLLWGRYSCSLYHTATLSQNFHNAGVDICSLPALVEYSIGFMKVLIMNSVLWKYRRGINTVILHRTLSICPFKKCVLNCNILKLKPRDTNKKIPDTHICISWILLPNSHEINLINREYKYNSICSLLGNS